MKRINLNALFTLICLIFCALKMGAQYATPGTGVSWNFNDLTTNSGGAVTQNDNIFTVHQNITISATDTLKISSDIIVKIGADIQLIVDGAGASFLIDAPSRATFTALDPSTTYGVIEIAEGSMIHWKNALFEYGKGIKVIDSDFKIDSCIIQNMDYTSNTSGAISGTRGKIIIKNCSFLNNQRSAVTSGANMGTTFIICDSYFYNNTLDNSNRPQINLGPSQESDTTKIIGNRIIGVDKTMVGGIGCSSLLGITTTYIIDNNEVANNRYGVTFTGNGISAWIRYNRIVDNNLETNPMNGGSGINITGSSKSTNVFISNNLITGNLWGITLVRSGSEEAPVCNLGNLASGDNYNEGKNVFNDNGNNGVLYDFYNNTPNDIMAQNNLWGVAEQTEEAIETVIFHKPDNNTLGTVSFMSPYQNSANPPQQFEVAFVNHQALFTWKRPDALPFEQINYHFYKNGDLLSTTDTTTFIDENLLFGMTEYCVTAVYENALESEMICIQTDLPCDPPQNFNAILTGTDVELSWQQPGVSNLDVIEYQIYRNEILLTTTSETKYTDTSPELNTYNYCVKAVYNAGECESTEICEKVIFPLKINDLHKNSIIIYPNPASSVIHIQGENIVKIFIYNLTGNLVATKISELNSIDVTFYPSGIYFLKIQKENGDTITKRIIVLH